MATTEARDDARTILMSPAGADMPELLDLALRINRDGPPFHEDLPTSLVVDILEVHEVDTWSRTARKATPSPAPFQPHWTIPRDGHLYRAFIPADLKPDDEQRVRRLATESQNVLVRARFFHVLWVRFRHFPDAKAAYEARFGASEHLLLQGSWPRVVANLGHLTSLLLETNARAQLDALVASVDMAAEKLLRSETAFSFSVLADVMNNLLLTKKAGRDAFTRDRGQRWLDNLETIATKYEKDAFHGHDALIILQDWYSRWGDQEKCNTTRRRIVEQLVAVAQLRPETASWIIQKALKCALDYGIADLAEKCRLESQRAIKAEIPRLKQISGQFQIPKELLEQIDPLIAEASTPAVAIRALASYPGLLEIDRDQAQTNAEKTLTEHPLMQFVHAAHYHREGKVTFQAKDPEGNARRQLGITIAFHLVMLEALLGHALGQLIPSVTPATLIEALADWPYLADARKPLLAVASERFAKRDWISSGFIIIILYEAVLRDLLRAVGYSALKVETDGTQMDETLNSLLRAAQVREFLGHRHCDFVEFVLCDPALGWNLRNELAHGTTRAEALSPTRVFLAWLLLVRLTCYVNTAGAEPAADEQQEGFPEEPPP